MGKVCLVLALGKGIPTSPHNPGPVCGRCDYVRIYCKKRVVCSQSVRVNGKQPRCLEDLSVGKQVEGWFTWWLFPLGVGLLSQQCSLGANYQYYGRVHFEQKGLLTEMGFLRISNTFGKIRS